MLLVHGRRTARSTAPTGEATCPDCGHPAATPATSTLAHVWRRVHPASECFHAEYEYSVLRDGWCGCRSEAHRR